MEAFGEADMHFENTLKNSPILIEGSSVRNKSLPIQETVKVSQKWKFTNSEEPAL